MLRLIGAFVLGGLIGAGIGFAGGISDSIHYGMGSMAVFADLVHLEDRFVLCNPGATSGVRP